MIEGLDAEQSAKFQSFINNLFASQNEGKSTVSVAQLKEMPFPMIKKEKYEELLLAADKNNDSQIDQSEFTSLTINILRALFDQMDLNKDGRISIEEFKTANSDIPEEVATAMFAAADANQDGQLSFAELVAVLT